MDSLNITDEIVSFLTDALAETQLQTKDENVCKSPAVYDGYLPPKKNTRRGEEDKEQDYYPFVIVRFLFEQDALYKQNTMKFKFLIGTYSKDERQGWRDTLLVMNRIKFALKEAQTIGPADLTGEIESALFEEQMKPMWHGVMEVDFLTPQVQWNGSVAGDGIDY
ncbi:hypothetical protein [Lysinibacillus sphaericus]|uniref:Phage protein n=1 Tax=Lysinibacillus sphaericus OT4b.31 TaxID=1285586 RepID=R7Z8C7_LYSSH|nr:hypothetical protein [Lysinibacillus sphaericus]EON70402.1 hypothetical protein H131_21862 [Lysinibacillus sphaericus OT4b.31]